LAAGLIADHTLSVGPPEVVDPAATAATFVDKAPIEEEDTEDLLKLQQAELERMDREEAEREKQRQDVNAGLIFHRKAGAIFRRFSP
jgi:hypothetical protein